MAAFAKDNRCPDELAMAMIARRFFGNVFMAKLAEDDAGAVDTAAVLEDEGDVGIGEVSLGRPL